MHYKEIPGKPKHYEESGFYVGNDYYIIKETAYQSNIAIDYSHAKSDGYAVIPTQFSLSKITMNSVGDVVFDCKIGSWDSPEVQHRKQSYAKYYQMLLEKSQKADNPLATFPTLIGMELDIPDYDTDKNNAKIVGKRTSKLLKTLESDLNKKLKQDKLLYGLSEQNAHFLRGNLRMISRKHR